MVWYGDIGQIKRQSKHLNMNWTHRRPPARSLASSSAHASLHLFDNNNLIHSMCVVGFFLMYKSTHITSIHTHFHIFTSNSPNNARSVSKYSSKLYEKCAKKNLFYIVIIYQTIFWNGKEVERRRTSNHRIASYHNSILFLLKITHKYEWHNSQ